MFADEMTRGLDVVSCKLWEYTDDKRSAMLIIVGLGGGS